MNYSKKYEFDAEILKHEGMNAAFIEFPYNVEDEFGVKGQVKVVAYFDGYEYRGSLAKMGHECHFLGINQQVRQAIKKNTGDMVHIVIQRDTEPRAVEIPEDVMVAFEMFPEIKERFDKLSYTHRKENIQLIEGAKKPETRNRRIEKFIHWLLEK